VHGAFGAAAILILLAILLGSAPASAHHSFAMFDHVNRVTLVGTVTQSDPKRVPPRPTSLLLKPEYRGGS
jgi:hypothetical protein